MNNGKNWPASAPSTETQSSRDAKPPPRRRLTWLADFFPIAGSLLLWAVPIALLPPDVAGATLIGAIAAARWLCRPQRERLAVRLLAHGAPISQGQEVLLLPALARLEEVGLAPHLLYVAPARNGHVLAEPVGRRSTVLAPRLLAAVAYGSVDVETLAAVLAHAEARRAARFGMQHDIALRIVLVTGRAIASLVRGLARRLRWMPAVGMFPAIAAVVIGTAICQSFAEGLWWVGVVIAMAASAVAISRSARATWTDRVDRSADRLVASRGLSVPLVHLLLSEGSRRSLDRAAAVGNYQAAPAAPIRRLRVVSNSSA